MFAVKRYFSCLYSRDLILHILCICCCSKTPLITMHREVHVFVLPLSIIKLSFFYRVQLKGSIDDCSCNIDTVDYFNNNKIYPRLRSLLTRDYFRFWKVNLRKDCPFWSDDSKCAMRSCHVSMCEEKDIPEGLKGAHSQEESAYKVNGTPSIIYKVCYNENV